MLTDASFVRSCYRNSVTVPGTLVGKYELPKYNIYSQTFTNYARPIDNHNKRGGHIELIT